MAINFDAMLLKTKPLSPLNLDIGGGGGMSLERERMKLMREQFENTKRQQEEQRQLAKLEEEGRNARERMTNERARQQAEAQAAAALQTERLKAHTEFTKLNGQGDIEGARAMVPLMSNLGMSVEVMGQENGLPSYLIDMSEEDRQKRLQSEQAAEAAEVAPGISSTADAFGAARLATRGPDEEEAVPDMDPTVEGVGEVTLRGSAPQAPSHFQATGQPLRGPDKSAIDTRKVLDLGAMAASTRARLDPVMGGLVNAYPMEQQASARSTADAMMASGLPATEAIKEFRAQRGGPDSAANSETVARGQSGNQAYSRRKEGFDQAQATFKETLPSLGVVEGAGQIRDILSNTNGEDDIQIVNLIVGMSGGKGTQTEGDIARALGMKSTSTLDQIVSFLETKAAGGLSEVQKRGILSYVDSAERRAKNRVFAWMDNVDKDASRSGADPDEAAGAMKFRDYQIPRALRQEYEEAKKRGKGSKPGGSAQQRSFNMEQDSRAEYGAGGTVIPESSRISFEHNNPGNLKFVGQEGAEKGEPAQDGGHWAKFTSVDAGMEALRAQVLKDSERGLSVEEFITKYAPPGSNDTKLYIEQAMEALKARPGDSLAELDPYDVVRFIAKKESGTELPDQYTSDGAPSQAASADPLEAKRARLAELKAKAGVP